MDKSSITTRVNASALNQGQIVGIPKNMTEFHVSVFVQTDQKPVRTLRLLIMKLANAAVLTLSSVQEDKSLTRPPVDVSAPNLGQNVPSLSHMMISHVSVLVQIDRQLAPTRKFLTMTSAYADALK